MDDDEVDDDYYEDDDWSLAIQAEDLPQLTDVDTPTTTTTPAPRRPTQTVRPTTAPRREQDDDIGWQLIAAGDN